MNRTIVALDFYGKGICAAVALFDTEQGSVSVTRLERFETPHLQDGQVSDLASAQDELNYVLGELSPNMGLSPKIVLGLRGPMLSFKRSSGFKTTDARNCIIRESSIKEAISNAIPAHLGPEKQIVHVWPQSFVLEGQYRTQNPLGRQGITLEAETFISFADTAYLSDLKAILGGANITPDTILASAVPVAQQLPSETEKQNRTLILDIGDTSTSALIYHKGLLVEGKTFAFGHNFVVRQFADLLQNDIAEAQAELEKYKDKPEPDEVTEDLIEDATAALLEKIHKELSAASVYYVQNPPVNLILTGCGITAFTAPIAKEIFPMRKVRTSFLDTSDINPEADLGQFTGVLALLYHILQLSEPLKSTSAENAKEGFLEKWLGKLGLS